MSPTILARTTFGLFAAGDPGERAPGGLGLEAGCEQAGRVAEIADVGPAGVGRSEPEGALQPPSPSVLEQDPERPPQFDRLPAPALLELARLGTSLRAPAHLGDQERDVRPRHPVHR